MPIADVEAPVKPTMHCIGQITEVSDAKKTNSGWDSFSVSIEGGANSLSTKKLIMFDLDFFRGVNFVAAESPKDWKDETLTAEERQSKIAAMMFTQNFDKKKGCIAKALGDRYPEFIGVIDSLDAQGELTPEAVAAVTRQFLVGATILYKLKQQKEKQDDGTKIRTEYYDCDSFEAYSDKARKGVERGVKFSRSKGNDVLVAWEEAA